MERNPNDRWRPQTSDAEDWYAPIPERRPRPWHWLILALVTAMLVWELVQRPSAGDGRFRIEVEDQIAYAWGSTDTESFGDVARVLQANPQIETLILRDVPGTLDMRTNSLIARMIRERGIATRLEHDSFIASGGVHLFMGGVERTLECGAKIGVHSWKGSDGSTPRSLGFDPAEGYMVEFHADMGVDTGFYQFSRDRSPHEALYYVSAEQAERFALSTEACERVPWTERFLGVGS